MCDDWTHFGPFSHFSFLCWFSKRVWNQLAFTNKYSGNSTGFYKSLGFFVAYSQCWNEDSIDLSIFFSFSFYKVWCFWVVIVMLKICVTISALWTFRTETSQDIKHSQRLKFVKVGQRLMKRPQKAESNQRSWRLASPQRTQSLSVEFLNILSIFQKEPWAHFMIFP